MDLSEFREGYLNDIKADAVSSVRYPIEVFIDDAVDILKNDYSLITDITQSFYEVKNAPGYNAFKSMRIDAGFLDLPSNTLNLLFADFNVGEIKSITNEFITAKSQLLINFFENCVKGYFRNAEQANPAVQLAHDVHGNLDYIYKIHCHVCQ